LENAQKKVPVGIRALCHTARRVVTILTTPVPYSHCGVRIQNVPNPWQLRKDPSRCRTT